MPLLNPSARAFKAVLQYSVAILSPWLVLGLVLLSPALRESPHVIFLSAVMISAWYGGLAPGLVAAFESALLSIYYLLPPIYSLRIKSPADGVRLAAFVFAAILISGLNAARKRATEELQSARDQLWVALQKEKEMSRADFLTGVANRRAFYEQLESECRRIQRSERPFTLAYIDVDDFKAVNDLHGHNAGDKLLVSAASALRSTVRQTDLVARVGGDEFAVLFPETDPGEARTILGKMHRALLDSALEVGFPVTFSIGAVTLLSGSVSADQLMLKADELMYTAKKAGKNRCEVTSYEGSSRDMIATRPAQRT